jgi:hypothetical protein
MAQDALLQANVDAVHGPCLVRRLERSEQALERGGHLVLDHDHVFASFASHAALASARHFFCISAIDSLGAGGGVAGGGLGACSPAHAETTAKASTMGRECRIGSSETGEDARGR